MRGTEVRDLVTRASWIAGRDLVPLRALGGGEHAITVLARDHESELVIRAFPIGDQAVAHEVQVLTRLGALGPRAPLLVAYAHDADEPPVIVTSRVPGGHPPADLPASTIAGQMAAALAAIHRLPGEGLRLAPSGPPIGKQPVVVAAQRAWPRLAMEERVLTHYDFWCGNALWTGGVLTGVIDWSGSRNAPRGVDVAWCRLDLVLLGSTAAAARLLHDYEHAAGRRIEDIRAWDIQAAAQAVTAVEEWAPNYHAIGRTELDAPTLRRRLDQWVAHLLDEI